MDRHLPAAPVSNSQRTAGRGSVTPPTVDGDTPGPGLVTLPAAGQQDGRPQVGEGVGVVSKPAAGGERAERARAIQWGGWVDVVSGRCAALTPRRTALARVRQRCGPMPDGRKGGSQPPAQALTE